jgi:hypothetical protein
MASLRQLVEEGFGHLTTASVVDADEKHRDHG